MSSFEVKVYKLKIEPHHNADALEIAIVGDYRSIVAKGIFTDGSLGVYIPEASIVPDWLIEKLGLTGRLAGPNHNRVKAVKLRGIVSQGLIYPVTTQTELFLDDNRLLTHSWIDICPALGGIDPKSVVEGDDVQVELGITKWEPPIPVRMAGEVFNAFGYTLSYDIENIKKFPDVFDKDEEVVMTEKLHGTWTCLGHNVNVGDIVTSKGLSGQGLAFKFNEANKDNLYIRTLNSTVKVRGDHDFNDGWENVEENVIERAFQLFSGMHSFYILGETFGKGVQDLAYGTDKPQFRVFDIYLGEPGQGRYLGYNELVTTCKALDVEMVPVLYKGPYSKEKLLAMTNGKETISGACANIREGLVVKPMLERRHPEIGRVQLKSVSDAYLLRGGDVTELT